MSENLACLVFPDNMNLVASYGLRYLAIWSFSSFCFPIIISCTKLCIFRWNKSHITFKCMASHWKLCILHNLFEAAQVVSVMSKILSVFLSPANLVQVLSAKMKNQGYGSPADIWSLGCTVLEMLTRQVPYPGLEPVRAIFITTFTLFIVHNDNNMRWCIFSCVSSTVSGIFQDCNGGAPSRSSFSL